MMDIQTSLTVFFDGPFWVGVFEIVDGGMLSVCKVIFVIMPQFINYWY